ncbi:hypothetical protein DCCM_0576 [Desulfocucumis palustris]|uniref:Uncharacterized protein n=1 Tax=Desulfocucumis palustris TaxID=1898651 RepID=A0A2L2X8Q6_9FIRM|nr:hypothetical protein DCCM_0576 [Desulfocucumis palustris]
MIHSLSLFFAAHCKRPAQGQKLPEKFLNLIAYDNPAVNLESN